MSEILNRVNFAVATILLVLSTALPGLAGPIDSTLFTNYTITPNATNVNLVVCGSLPGSVGCYGSGSLGPFTRVGALLEGNTTTHGSVVTRLIYVVDVNTPGNGVVLNIYKKTDTIVGSSDTVNVSFFKSINLPLTGGSTARCSMAANKKFLFVGTDQGTLAVQVAKKDLSMISAGGFNLPVTQITADKYGFVTITQGTNGGQASFTTYDPNGQPTEEGGGAPFLLNPLNAALPSTFP